MVKIVPKLERMQTDTVDRLAKEVDRVTAEFEQVRSRNGDLEAENARLRRTLERNRVGITLKAKAPTKSASSSIPSYLRPTIASKLRTKDLDNPSQEDLDGDQSIVEDERSIFYQDGKLVRVGIVVEQPNYLSTTESSRNKGGHDYGRLGSEPGEPLLQIQPHEEEEAPPESPIDRDLVKCLMCTLHECSIVSSTPNALAVSTRLEDGSWRRSPEGQLFVPYRVQNRLLSSGHRIAQDIIWKATRTHWPDLQNFHYADGPREVKLGRNELHNVFGSTIDRPDFAKGMCCGAHWRVCDMIFDLVALRNTKLAVLFEDEKQATKVRRLRDELRDEARKVHEEIETLHVLLTDPMCRKQWKVHHERTFREATSNINYQMRFEYAQNCTVSWSPVVKNAASDWAFARQRKDPGIYNKAYKARVNRAKLFVSMIRVTPTGQRHGSFSGVSSSPMYDHVKTDWSGKKWTLEEKRFASALNLTESAASKKAGDQVEAPWIPW